MTFCVGIRVADGLVALADTMVIKGDEWLSKGKLEVIDCHGHPVFVMTSGLRSVRDKVVIYLLEWLQQHEGPLDRLYQVANAFGACVRRVREEDEAALSRDGLQFNSHAIIGGRLGRDALPTLFYIYPAGNWIEANRDSPYFIIGRTSYGKPILDRLLSYDTSLATAVGLGYLAFDATRASVIDVDFPVEILVQEATADAPCQHRFGAHELLATSAWWRDSLAQALGRMPMQWAAPLFPDRRATAQGDG